MSRYLNVTSVRAARILFLSLLILFELSSLVLANNAPTITSPASVDFQGYDTQASLAVLGDDDAGETNLTYTWSTIGTVPGSVTFSDNGTNDSKNTIVFFTQAGTYDFQILIQDAQGLFVTSSISVTVNQDATSIDVEPLVTSLYQGYSQTFTAEELDQFNNLMSVQPVWDWDTNLGTIDTAGNYDLPLVFRTPS